MRFSISHLTFQKTVASLGVVNNLILLVLIFSKSPRQLGYYKYLMSYITIFEILYSFLDFLSIAEIFSKDSLYVIIIHKRQASLPDCLLKYANIAFCSLFGMSMAIFSIHFVYRYLIVTGNRYLEKNHRNKVMSLIVFTIIVGFIWSFGMDIFLKNNPYSDLKLRNDYLETRNMSLTDIDYIGAHFHMMDEHGNHFINWMTMVAVILMTVVICLSFLTVFYCGHGIYSQMEEMSSVQSSEVKNLQSQLFWALVFQTLIPIILMHIPASIGFITAMCDSTVEILGKIATVTIYMYPALDPIPNFFIIKSFRQAILEFLCCKKKVIAPQNSNAINSQKLAVVAVSPI